MQRACLHTMLVLAGRQTAGGETLAAIHHCRFSLPCQRSVQHCSGHCPCLRLRVTARPGQPPTTTQQGWAGLVRSALRLRLRLSLAATHGNSFSHALNTHHVWNTRSHRTASLSSLPSAAMDQRWTAAESSAASSPRHGSPSDAPLTMARPLLAGLTCVS